MAYKSYRFSYPQLYVSRKLKENRLCRCVKDCHMNLTELTALVRVYCLYRSVEISKGRSDMKKNKPLFYEMRVLSIVVAVLLTGCSTYLKSQHLSQLEELPKGVLYSLPMLQYELDITRQLIACEPEVEVQITVDVKEDFMPDPNATFVLDYTELAGIANTSELEVDFHKNGTLKSFNLEADDHSAEIIANAFKVISNVTLVAVGVPPLPYIKPAPPKKPVCPVCDEKSKNALSAIQKSDPDVKRLTKNVENASEKVGRLNLIVAGADKPSEQTLQDLQEAVKVLKQHKQALVNLNKNRAPYLAQVQYKEKQRWPKSTAGDIMKTSFPPIQILKNRWFIKDKEGRTVCDEIVNEKLTLHVAINPLVANIPSYLPEKSSKGVFYRYPMPIELVICTDAPCDKQTRKIAKTIRSKAPQYGPLVLLPFENSAFQNNQLEVAFSVSGLPSKLTFKNKRSAAEAASGAAAGIAEQLPALRQQLLNADLEKLKRETALFEQEQALQDAKQSLEPSPTADIEAQMALIKAQTDLVNAQIAIEEAQRKLDEQN